MRPLELPNNLKLKLINKINEEWQKKFENENTVYDFIEYPKIKASIFDFSCPNEYYSLAFHNLVCDDSYLIIYKSLNEIVNDFEISFSLSFDELQLINKDLINISNIFTYDDGIDIYFGHQNNWWDYYTFIVKLYKSKRFYITDNFDLILDKKNLAKENSDEEGYYPAFIYAEEIMRLYSKVKIK